MRFVMRTLILLSFILSFISASAQTPIASWNFNGDAKDKSGNGWDAIVYGCTLTTGKAGKPNTAYYFNGSGNYMMVPHNAGMNMNTWTMMALVKPKGFYSGLCQGSMILERGLFYTGSSHSLFINDNEYDNDCNVYTPTQMVFGISAAGTSTMNKQNGLFVDTVNTWYCVTATYGNDTAKIYVNGVMIEKGYWQNQYGAGITDSLRIGTGTKQSVGYPNWFKGVMDHINIYNSVLTAAQIDSACSKATNDTPTVVGEIPRLKEEVIISPNPATKSISVTIPSLREKPTVYIINTVGQTLLTKQADKVQTEINIETLPAGLYIIKVAYRDDVLFGRLLKN
jgi:hypothetical protein